MMSDRIHQEVTFKAKPADVYAALMDSRKHTAFTMNGPAKINKKVGGAFSAHGGFVSGINLDLVADKRIVQAWRGKDWPKGIFSIVSFTLVKNGRGTRLVFDQTGIPDGKSGHLESGWKAMYWDKLSAYFES
jgi:activator of HSP90 ATPase